MSSKRVKIAKDVVDKNPGKFLVGEAMVFLYALEQAGYQVVKAEATTEYKGLRNA